MSSKNTKRFLAILHLQYCYRRSKTMAIGLTYKVEVYANIFWYEFLISLSLRVRVRLIPNVTCNHISVINVTAHRCAGGLKKIDQRWGSKCHRLFLELFNVLVQAPKRGQPLKVIPRNRPISVAFYNTHGDR